MAAERGPAVQGSGLDVLILGATGKVGRMLQRHWPESAPRPLWHGRSAAPAPGWAVWAPGTPLPAARVVILLSGVTTERADTGATLDDNPRIGLQVAEAAARAGVRHVLLASSIAVYGRTPPEGATERTPPDGPRAYGLSKLATEEVIAARLAGTGTGLTALRLGNVAGADMLADVVASGRTVRMDRFADGTGPVRSYAGGRFLARTLAALCGHVLSGAALPERLNVAGQHPVAMADLLGAAGIPFEWATAGPAAWQHVTMDCTGLAALVPRVPEEETPAALAADWREARP
jgi:nucleoside-diphosphate-sugar epimerase